LADAGAQLGAAFGEDAFEEGYGGGSVASTEEEEAKLGGGEVVFGGVFEQESKFVFGALCSAHFEVEIGEFAAEGEIRGVQIEGRLELGDVGVAGGKEAAGPFGGAGLGSARGGEEGGGGLMVATEMGPSAAEVEQEGSIVRAEAPGGEVVGGGKVPFVAFGGEASQLAVSA
jgi:hypothetical protein